MSSSLSSRIVKTVGAKAAAQTIALRAQVALLKLRSMTPMRNVNDNTSVVKLRGTPLMRNEEAKVSYVSSNQQRRHSRQIKPAVPTSSAMTFTRSAKTQGLGQGTSTKGRNGTTKRSKKQQKKTTMTITASGPRFAEPSIKRGAGDCNNAATAASAVAMAYMASSSMDFHPVHAREENVGMARVCDTFVSDQMDSPKRRRLTPQSPPTTTTNEKESENESSASSSLCILIPPPHDPPSSHIYPSRLLSSSSAHPAQQQPPSQSQYGINDGRDGIDGPLGQRLMTLTSGGKIKKTSSKKSTGGGTMTGGKTGDGMVKMVGVKHPNTTMVSANPHFVTTNGRKEQGEKAGQGKNATTNIITKNNHHPLPLTMAATAPTAAAAAAASTVVSQSQRRKAFDQAWRARTHPRVASCNNSNLNNKSKSNNNSNRNSNSKSNSRSNSNNRRLSRLDAVTVTDLCSLLDDSALGRSCPALSLCIH